MAEINVCRVCIPNTYAHFYDYLMPDSPPSLGCRVVVPFRNSEKIGIVWDYGVIHNPSFTLKDLIKVDAAVVLDDALRAFCSWLSEYYHVPLSEVLALALPKWIKDIDRPLSLEPTWHYRLLPDVIAPARSKRLISLVDYLKKGLSPFSLEQFKEAGFEKALITKACEQQLIEPITPIEAPLPATSLVLNEEQQQAVNQVQLNGFHVYLLQGVTGSGKTEVYIELIKSMIANQKQVLMLVPEIGLTTALYERMKKRLGTQVLMLHSELTDKTRYENWIKSYLGQAKLILGTRSAIFSNIPQLGLIIIDEEHDGSFKQLDGIRYSAKDAAIMRAKMLNIPVMLGTATPALETYQNVLNQKYQLLNLYKKALSQHANAYHIIDLRQQTTEHGLAKPALNMIESHLQRGEQVFIFINRRGYAPLIFCHDCGWSKQCKYCDANMTWHKKTQRLMCHHCGAQADIPKHCESCFSNQLQPFGVGTERLLTFLEQAFPEVSCMRFDRDVVQNRAQLEQSLNAIYQEQVQLIIGTQMLTKGHHFPKLGLVVIVDGDSGFYHADFRALERLGQLFTQVAGRTGRADIPGEVCIQTHLPQHPLLLTLLKDGYATFMEELLQQRKDAFLPPYAHMALIRAQGKHSKVIQSFLQQLKIDSADDKIQIFGPAPAPMEKKAGMVRWQLILKSAQRQSLHQFLKKVSHQLLHDTPKGIRSFIEIDPYDWSA